MARQPSSNYTFDVLNYVNLLQAITKIMQNINYYDTWLLHRLVTIKIFVK